MKNAPAEIRKRNCKITRLISSFLLEVPLQVDILLSFQLLAVYNLNLQHLIVTYWSNFYLKSTSVHCPVMRAAKIMMALAAISALVLVLNPSCNSNLHVQGGSIRTKFRVDDKSDDSPFWRYVNLHYFGMNLHTLLTQPRFPQSNLHKKWVCGTCDMCASFLQ